MIGMQGILWADITRKKPVAECVREAAVRYRRRFGKAPTVCYVRAINGTDEVDGVRLRVDRYRQPFEYWIGIA